MAGRSAAVRVRPLGEPDQRLPPWRPVGDVGEDGEAMAADGEGGKARGGIVAVFDVVIADHVPWVLVMIESSSEGKALGTIGVKREVDRIAAGS
jgi:hypothetical protein